MVLSRFGGGGGGGGFHGLSCIVGLLKMFRYSCMYPGEGAGVSGSPENRRNQVRIQRGDRGSGPPRKITSYMGFYRE